MLCTINVTFLREINQIQCILSQHFGYWWPGTLARCFSTRALVATVRSVHPCFSNCLWVKVPSRLYCYIDGLPRYIDGLANCCGDSSVLTLESPLSYTQPSICDNIYHGCFASTMSILWFPMAAKSPWSLPYWFCFIDIKQIFLDSAMLWVFEIHFIKIQEYPHCTQSMPLLLITWRYKEPWH